MNGHGARRPDREPLRHAGGGPDRATNLQLRSILAVGVAIAVGILILILTGGPEFEEPELRQAELSAFDINTDIEDGMGTFPEERMDQYPTQLPAGTVRCSAVALGGQVLETTFCLADGSNLVYEVRMAAQEEDTGISTEIGDPDGAHRREGPLVIHQARAENHVFRLISADVDLDRPTMVAIMESIPEMMRPR